MSRRHGLVALLAGVGLVGCGSFEDPAIVLDLRVLAMRAEPPEQLFPVDPANPAASLLGIDPAPIEVCALVAEPDRVGPLAWSMRICPETRDLRCDLERPFREVATGVIDDPDTTSPAPLLCTTYDPGGELVPVLMDALSQDQLLGFGGIDLVVELRVGPDGQDLDLGQYAAKRVRFAAQLPVERTANRNPTVDSIEGFPVPGAPPVSLPLGRCADGVAVEIASGTEVVMAPAETAGAREDYLVPTFEGDARMFREYLSYQWLATAGDWSRESTGGPRDGVGNTPPLDTLWRAPFVDVATTYTLWMIQRDERLGVSWQELCARVTP